MDKKTIVIIAGEASGDLQGAHLARALRELYPEVEILGVGGPKMRENGVRLFYDSSTWGAIGVFEALPRVPYLLKVVADFETKILQENPALLILIDSPAINIRLAKFAKRHNIKTIYYFPPSAWYTSSRRAMQLCALTDSIIATFQYTVDSYRKANLPVQYFGHPLKDLVPTNLSAEAIRTKHELPEGKRFIGLLPGSRSQEITQLLPILLQTARNLLERYPDLFFLLPIALPTLKTMVQKLVSECGLPLKIITGNAHEVMKMSSLLLMASGSASLEAALIGTPMITLYKLSKGDWFLAKLIVRTKYIALPNLIAQKPLVPELLQDEVTPEKITEQACKILDSPELQAQMITAFKEIREGIGEPGVIQRVAQYVGNFMTEPSKAFDVVLVTNSPGELFAWAKVTAEKLRSMAPRARIIIMLVPCPYATGKEEEIALKFAPVDLVLGPKEFVRLSANLPLKKYFPLPKGVVVFLGGDYWHALMASKRLGFPALAYAVRPSYFHKFFKYICVPDNNIKQKLLAQGVQDQKIEIIGNLMVEGVRPRMPANECRAKLGLQEDNLILGILPGSRLYHVQESIPVFLKVADEIHALMPGVKFVLGLSPFLTVDELSACIAPGHNTIIHGSSGRVETRDNFFVIYTDLGTEVLLLQDWQYDIMQISDLVLTIPGTNTAEIAYSGKPMIVASTWKAKIPRGGIAGLIGNVPLPKFRKYLMQGMLKRMRFTSLPNQIADREIVPEVNVETEASEITQVVIELLRDEARRIEMGETLKALMGEQGAGEKISRLILSLGAS
jgi:lipid-A-disaccharide synthase